MKKNEIKNGASCVADAVAAYLSLKLQQQMLHKPRHLHQQHRMMTTSYDGDSNFLHFGLEW
jgi:hypothetical protein